MTIDYLNETQDFSGNKNITEMRPVVLDVNANGNDEHRPDRPIFRWFQSTPVGKELFIVFYTKQCEWSRCSFCTLPSESSTKMVHKDSIRAQCDYVFEQLNSWQKNSVKRVFLSNNGSILNQDIMSPESLRYICETSYKELPNLEVICLETRFETVEDFELEEHLSLYSAWHDLYRKDRRKAQDPVQLQITAGYETQDTFLRNKVLCKGYSEGEVIKFFELCKRVTDKHNKENSRKVQILSDEYVLLKPAVGMTDKEAEDECFQTIAHLAALGDKYNVPVSIRLNPTYVAKGSALYDEFKAGHYEPATLSSVVNVLLRCHESNINNPIFIGLNEEGLSVEGSATFLRKADDYKLMIALVEFNKDQDYEKLIQKIRGDVADMDPMIWKIVQGIHEVLLLQRDYEITNSELTEKIGKIVAEKKSTSEVADYFVDFTKTFMSEIRGEFGLHR